MRDMNDRTPWGKVGTTRKAYDPTRRRQSSVSRRRAAGGKLNKKHKFVGSFGSDRA